MISGSFFLSFFTKQHEIYSLIVRSKLDTRMRMCIACTIRRCLTSSWSQEKALSAESVWFRSCWLFIGFRAHLLLQLKLLLENWRKPHKRIIIVEGPDHGTFILLNRKAHFFKTWPSRIPSDSTNADMRMRVYKSVISSKLHEVACIEHRFFEKIDMHKKHLRDQKSETQPIWSHTWYTFSWKTLL